MGEYFGSWRKKIGALTLLLAGLLAVAGMRSLSRIDAMMVSARQFRSKAMMSETWETLVSVGNTLVWERAEEVANHPNYDVDFGLSRPRWKSSTDLPDFDGDNLIWKWRMSGLGRCERQQEIGTWSKASRYLIVPYWTIEVPLVLISMWLLLSGRRRSNPTQLANSVAPEQGFFHGWRRKIGLATLAVALLALCGLLRSSTMIDMWNFGSGRERQFYRLINTRFGLLWTFSWTEAKGTMIYPRGWQRTSFGPTDFQLERDFESPFFQIPYPLYLVRRWDWCGIGSGQLQSGLDERDQQKQRMTFWIIPFWILLWPATLLSAWLLLTKSGRSRAKTLAETRPESVA